MFEMLKASFEGKGENDFFRDEGKRKGQPVNDDRKAWKNGTKAAGVPESLVHDLRRTGARNMRRRALIGT